MNLLLLSPLLLFGGSLTSVNSSNANSTVATSTSLSSSDHPQLSSIASSPVQNVSNVSENAEQLPQAEALRYVSSQRSLSSSSLDESLSSNNNNLTDVEISQRHQQLSNRMLVALKLLQLVQQYSAVNGSSLADELASTQNNGTAASSESRSVTSWLRFRRPQKPHHQESTQTAPNSAGALSLLANFASSGSHHLPQTSPQQRLSSSSSYHQQHHSNNPFIAHSNSFSSKMPHSKNQNHNHNSLFYSLDDANGIDYWLKFLEDANFEERLPPLSGGQLAEGGGGGGAFQIGLPKLKEKTLLKMKPMSGGGGSLSSSPFKRVKANRYRSKTTAGGHQHSGRNHNSHHQQHRPHFHNNQRHSGGDGHRKTSKGHHPQRHHHPHHHRPHYTLGSIEPLRNLHVGESADFESDNGGSGNGHNELSLLTDSKPTDSTKQVAKQSAAETYTADTSPRCDKFTDEICIDDFEYPENAILEEIFQRKDIFQLMYSEVKGDAPLVDGIARDEEESFSQDYYYNNNDPEGEDYDGGGGGGGSSNRTEYNAVLSVLYAKPKLARNIKGKWKVIVNAGEFTQTIRLEKCTRPNAECRFISDHKYDSRCAQISAIHRLLVFEKGKGFYIDTFRVPTACTCHVMSSKSSYQAGDTGATTSSSSSISKREKIKSNLGETLWSLLGTEPDRGKGGGGDGGDRRGGGGSHYIVGSGDHRHHSKSGNSGSVDLLKLLPQLTSIAPENVLQQLLDEYADSHGNQRNPSSSSSANKGYGNRVSGGTRTRYLPKIPKSELQQLLQFAQAQNSGTVLTGDDSSSGEHSSGSGSGSQHKRNRISEGSSSSSYLQHSSKAGTTGTTTTTIVNSSDRGAPVVQVIHVPVTTSEMSQSQRITNSSVSPPPPPLPLLGQSSDGDGDGEHKSKTDSEQPNSASSSNEAKRKAAEKRVNFSYHPILDYIAT
ncbi:Neurotrophin 1 Source FlyBase [Tyrophagus putrescentiae]|nr:Neurotrophin 1 Source FlyBase [Tyrophagus putrescentiae]